MFLKTSPYLKYSKLFQLLTVYDGTPSFFILCFLMYNSPHNFFRMYKKSTFIMDLLDIAHFLRLHFEDGHY